MCCPCPALSEELRIKDPDSGCPIHLLTLPGAVVDLGFAAHLTLEPVRTWVPACGRADGGVPGVGWAVVAQALHVAHRALASRSEA